MWLALGRVCLVALVACGPPSTGRPEPAGNAFAPPPRDGPAEAPYPTGPTASVKKPEHAPTLPPPPLVEGTLAPTSATASYAAKYASYERGWAPTLSPELTRELASQSKFDAPTARKLYEAAPADRRAATETTSALLACFAHSDQLETKTSGIRLAPVHDPKIIRGTKSTTRVDLRVTATLSSMPKKSGFDDRPIIVEGADDTGDAYFTLPVVSLKRGEHVSLRIDNRGVILDDGTLGTLKLSFEGHTPLGAKGKLATVECRVVAEEMVESELRRALGRIDEVTSAIDREMVVEEDLEFGRAAILRPSKLLLYAAAMHGWAEPRLVARIHWLRTLEKRWFEEVGAKVDELDKSVPSGPSKIEKTTMQVTKVSCDPKKRPKLGDTETGCIMHAYARSTDGSFRSDHMWFTDRQGVHLPLIARSIDGKPARYGSTLPTDKDAEVVFEILVRAAPTTFIPYTAFDGEASRRPFLVGFVEHGHYGYLRVP